MISIKLDSRQISINKMGKKSYSINLPKILFEYHKPRSYNVSSQGDLFNPGLKKFSKKSPFIINAWKIYDSELSVECKNAEVQTFLNTDGRFYGVDLLIAGGKVMVEDASERPIQIKFNRESTTQLPSKSQAKP